MQTRNITAASSFLGHEYYITHPDRQKKPLQKWSHILTHSATPPPPKYLKNIYNNYDNDEDDDNDNDVPAVPKK
jgi:hypothetical protein